MVSESEWNVFLNLGLSKKQFMTLCVVLIKQLFPVCIFLLNSIRIFNHLEI